MATRKNPTVRRRRLVIELRRLRHEAGLSLDDAGKHLRKTAATMSRIENARGGIQPDDVARLLDLYGITDEAQREPLLTLAREARLKGWWHRYGSALPEWFQSYVGLESAASSIHMYQLKLVPGLLQTEGYARAILTAGRRFDTLSEANRQVDIRMRRQEILSGENPTKLMVILDEGVLRCPVGGEAVMRAQLKHLIEMSTKLNVEIQVLPTSAGEHMLLDGSFVLLRFPEEPSDPAVVYLEYLGGSLYLDEPEDSMRYDQVFRYLQMVALNPNDSVELISSIAMEE